MKPYYNPKTKETYLKFDNITFYTGSVELTRHPSNKLKGIKVERNQFGEIIKETIFDSHVVCFGIDRCVECGKVIK